MKKFLIITGVFSLILLSGCSLFSGKNSEENVQNKEIQDKNIENQQEVKVDEQVLPQAEAQNKQAEKDAADIKESTVAEVNNEESAEAKLAKCITSKGAVLYTSSTCPHCKTQKELFKDGVIYLDNVECLAMDGWSRVCKDNEVNAVPTWIFADGQRLTGATPLETLAAKTGCEYESVVE